MKDDRYVACLSCGHFISAFENSQLAANVDCPKCGWQGGLLRGGAFGPTVWVEDYEGLTLNEAIEQRERKQRSRHTWGNYEADH